MQKGVGAGEDPDMLGDGAGLHAEEDQRAGTGLYGRHLDHHAPRAIDQHLARSGLAPSRGCKAGSGTARGPPPRARRRAPTQGSRSRRPSGSPGRDRACRARSAQWRQRGWDRRWLSCIAMRCTAARRFRWKRRWSQHTALVPAILGGVAQHGVLTGDVRETAKVEGIRELRPRRSPSVCRSPRGW